MNNPFTDIMEHRSDAELVDLVENKRSDYQQVALDAAEAILIRRRVNFQSPDKDEIIVMTVDQIRAEIIARSRNGESMSRIKQDFEEQGVDIDAMEMDARREDQTYVDKQFQKVRIGWFFGGTVLAFIINYRNQSPYSLPIIFEVIVTAVVLFLLLKRR